MIITISTTDLVLGLITIGGLLGAAAWLAKKLIDARIDKSIQYHYDKELENYKTSRARREKAELVAKLFSIWIKYRGRETKLLTNEELIERWEDLNRMSLELALWIEDVQLLNDVMTRLQNADNAKSIYALMGEVRKLILEKEDDFDPINIVL
ncbi:MAG: hypothetical protein Q8S35_02935, partial [bacterium]|nr:hypothetical protein [bacterium]